MCARGDRIGQRPYDVAGKVWGLITGDRALFAGKRWAWLHVQGQSPNGLSGDLRVGALT